MKKLLLLLSAVLMTAQLSAIRPAAVEDEDTVTIRRVELFIIFPSAGEQVPDYNIFMPGNPLYNRLGQVYIADISAHYNIEFYTYNTHDPFFMADSIYEMSIALRPKGGYEWDNLDSLAARSTINGKPIDRYATNGPGFFMIAYFKAELSGKRLSGRFTIDENGQQVQFAQGNLQYRPATATWHIAAYQDEIIGDANSQAAADYDGWIDLFGWGASGYNGLEPYTTTEEMTQYCTLDNLAGTDYDWVKVAADSIGLTGTWRTLTQFEWEFLLAWRPNADQLRGLARIDGVRGTILLPDDWDTDARPLNKETYTSETVLTGRQWFEWQKLGAVFLPYTGYREGTTVNAVSEIACYWTANEDGDEEAMYVAFSQDMDGPTYMSKAAGLAVRPVKVCGTDPTDIASPSLQGRSGEAAKILRDGQLLIERGGKTYNACGIEVR